MKSKIPISARITNIDQIGNMDIKFSQTMDTTNVDLEIIEQSIDIVLIPYFLEDKFEESLLDFTWEVKSFDGDQL